MNIIENMFCILSEQGGRYSDWLTCKKSLLGGHGKVRRAVI